MTWEHANILARFAVGSHPNASELIPFVTDVILVAVAEATAEERRRCAEIASTIDHGRRGDCQCCEHVSRDITNLVLNDRSAPDADARIKALREAMIGAVSGLLKTNDAWEILNKALASDDAAGGGK